MKKQKETSQQLRYYFRAEWKALVIVTVTGLFYNIGLLAGPFFEGKLAQCLFDMTQHTKEIRDMVMLSITYVLVIGLVQAARFYKRLYVRKFANHTNRRMKQILYGNLVFQPRKRLEQENSGSILTKAISDVDACVEGMRKFTTEIFDTGVALLGYCMLLLFYDWKLALGCLSFLPISYYLAEKMKTVVQKSGVAAKESAGRLQEATLDRISNSMTYRVYGCEKVREQEYDIALLDYEKKAVLSNVWVQSMPPLYQVISMSGVVLIFYFGSQNVQEHSWDIAMFTTFLACFTKLAVKSSKAAKLFNAVHKAEVSWKRIHPYLYPVPQKQSPKVGEITGFSMEGVGFQNVFSGLSMTAKPGQIIGITGQVACGKSVLGKVLLGELEHTGSIKILRPEPVSLETMKEEEREHYFGYFGHTLELFSDTIENNVLLGKEGDVFPYLEMTSFLSDLKQMPQGVQTRIGTGGILLSGGQQQRVILARTLAHPRPVYILDDPFSALDRRTEEEIFHTLKEYCKDSIVFLISHRLYLFPEMDQVIWMDQGQSRVSTHEELLLEESMYQELYQMQCDSAIQEAEGGER